MNVDEAAALFTTIQREWHSRELDYDVLRASLAADLERVPLAVATAAVLAIAAGPDRRADFPPTPGAILRKSAELDVAPPPWDQARAQLARQLAEVDRVKDADGMEAWDCPDGRGCVRGWVEVNRREAAKCSCFDAFVAHRRGTDRLDVILRRWIDLGHAPWEKVGKMLEGDTTAEAQLRNAWEAYAARAIESRVLELLPGESGLKRVEQARAEEGVRQVRERGRRGELAAAPAGLGDVRSLVGAEAEVVR